MEGMDSIGSVMLGGPVFTPWIPRPADFAVFSYEVIQNPEVGTVTVQVYHKNSEDNGPGTNLGVTFSTAGASTSVFSADTTAKFMKEMVRFRIECVSGETAKPLHYRIFEPTWFNKAEA